MASGDSEVTRLIKTTEHIKGKMVENVQKVEERQTKLDHLDMAAQGLKEEAGQFEKIAKKVKEKKQWEHYKLWCILIIIIVIIVVILIVTAGIIALFIIKPWEKH